MKFYDLYLREKDKYPHLSVSYKIENDVMKVTYSGLYGCRDCKGDSAFTKIEIEYDKDTKIKEASYSIGNDKNKVPLILNYKTDPYVFENDVDNHKFKTSQSVWKFGDIMTYFASHLDEDQCKEFCFVMESIEDNTKNYEKDELWYGFDDIVEEVDEALEAEIASFDEY